jgi:hypothetical protein
MKTIQELRAEEVTSEVNALPDLTDAQRTTVLGIALANAESHSLHFDAEGKAVNPPHYSNIANHVRYNPPYKGGL